MRRNIAQPANAGGFEADVRVETAGDSVLNDRLLLLFEELDEPLFRTDQPSCQRAVSVEEANNQPLLLNGRLYKRDP
jgi:hypothetical protein